MLKADLKLEPNHDFASLLTQAVCDVLETMFFTVPLGSAAPEPGETFLESRLAFYGHLCGALHVRVSETAARSLAAGFLGEDEEALSPAQAGQTVCELANMICGWLVSKLDSEERFDLDSPQLVSPVPDDLSSAPATSRQSFALENGNITVSLYLSVPV